MRSARAIFCLLLLVIGYLFLAAPKPALAQTNSPYNNTNSFNSPNTDPDVPRNQHYYAQSVTIEVLSAVFCQLTGIDPINPALGCLGINPQTNKLGLAPKNPDGTASQQSGGLIDATAGMIATLYTPTVSTSDYTRYLAGNFGIVKEAYAQSYGFDSLSPILELWKVVRNIAYMLMVLAFVFIGLGIMLRIKIDPRTVMSIQNQIPKMIMAILLITFSYAIGAIMVDLTWVSTYAGIYALTDKNDPVLYTSESGKCGEGEKLSERATKTILQTPITFFNQVFTRCTTSEADNPIAGDDKDGGFHVVTSEVSGAVGQTVNSILRSLLIGDKKPDCGIGGPFGGSLKDCLTQGATNALSNIVSIVMYLVIFVVLLVALFRVWFQLLKAYVYCLVYVITGPIFIVFGLWPTKPLGFEKWLRGLFVNLAVFPLTAFIFVAGRLLVDLYKETPGKFVPPLVGNPSDGANFGALLAFGAILIAPSIQTILREKMGVKGIGSPGLIAAGVAGGAAVVGAPVKNAMQHLNRRDQQGHAVGALARAKQNVGDRALDTAGRSKVFGGPARRIKGRREAVRGRDHRTSEGQAVADWKENNPGFVRNRWNSRKRKKNGNGGSTP